MPAALNASARAEPVPQAEVTAVVRSDGSRVWTMLLGCEPANGGPKPATTPVEGET